MKKILCVMDLRGKDEKALRLAAQLAGGLQSHLLVLCPYRLIGDNYDGGDISTRKRQLESDARRKFDELKSRLPGDGWLSIDFQTEIGFVIDRIMARVSRENIDIVVVSHDAMTGLGDWHSKSLSDLVARANVPIVIVPAEVTTPVPLT